MSVINTEYVCGIPNGVVCRVLENGDIVVAWVATNTKNWDTPPYHIKKAVSSDGGATWQTTELAASLGFTLKYWSYQRMMITSTGNIWYIAGGTTKAKVGYHNGTSWTWTSLDNFEASLPYNSIGIDEQDNPYFILCKDTDVYETWDTQLVYYNGTEFVAVSPPLAHSYFEDLSLHKDNVIHAIISKETGHMSDYGYPDEYDYYYVTSTDKGVTWSTPEYIVRYRNTWLGNMRIDQYNNMYVSFCNFDNDEFRPSAGFFKRDNLGRYSYDTVDADGTAWGTSYPFIASYFPNNKMYMVFADVDENYLYTKIRVLGVNPDGSKDEIIDTPMPEGNVSYEWFAPSNLSIYNGWIAMTVNVLEANPSQPQRFEIFKSEELPVTYTKRQVFEIMGLFTDLTGITEQNIDLATATDKWRNNGYPNIKMSDMVQVAVVKEKATGTFSAVNVLDFYANGTDNDYPPEEYEFVGLFWKNPLVEN